MVIREVYLLSLISTACQIGTKPSLQLRKQKSIPVVSTSATLPSGTQYQPFLLQDRDNSTLVAVLPTEAVEKTAQINRPVEIGLATALFALTIATSLQANGAPIQLLFSVLPLDLVF